MTDCQHVDGESAQADLFRLRYCPHCAYELRGLPGEGRCPECGGEYDASLIVLNGVALGAQAGIVSGKGLRAAGWTCFFGLMVLTNLWEEGFERLMWIGYALFLLAFVALAYLQRRSLRPDALAQAWVTPLGCAQVDAPGADPVVLAADRLLGVGFIIYGASALVAYNVSRGSTGVFVTVVVMFLLLALVGWLAMPDQRPLYKAAEKHASALLRHPGVLKRLERWRALEAVELEPVGPGRRRVRVQRIRESWMGRSVVDIEVAMTDAEAAALARQVEVWRGDPVVVRGV